MYVDADGTLHETYTAHVFVGGEFLGTFSYDSGRSDIRWNRSSCALFCSQCGEVWGRILALNERGEQQSFSVMRVECRKHYDQWNIAGSLLIGYLQHFLNDFPPAVIRREFELLIAKAETGD